MAMSYTNAKLFPIKPEKNLEDFFCNLLLEKKLYETFFKDYTDKVWGIPCNKIPSSWGAQRIKDLNISKLLMHAIVSLFRSDKTINQQKTSTSLIEQFLYPKYGPKQMWEAVAREIERLGGKIYLNTDLKLLECDVNKNILSAQIENKKDNIIMKVDADYYFSSMPVKELFEKMNNIPLSEGIKK